MHPLEAAERIRSDYARYLQTIYSFRDGDLRQSFREALHQPGFLVKGPFLEASPRFEAGSSLDDLIEMGILHGDFRELCSEALPLYRTLYRHQMQAIMKVAGARRNVVVATGTGSGKTEAFLIPILNHLLDERERGTLNRPGVRALLLYPMNALANDQIRRLRSVLQAFPEITFGRYTGETEETPSAAEDRFVEQFPGDARLPNELISRQALRAAPPHLLITNYAMLEYLLLRPTDSEFFDGETGRYWRFIVVDEAHIYDGASGIEVGMLLRRLKDRVVQSEPGRLTCIATSATLGHGPKDAAQVAAFATALFGEPFEWHQADTGRQDVVEATYQPWSRPEHIWGRGAPSLYGQLAVAIDRGDTIEELAGIAISQGVPSDVATKALSQASGDSGEQAPNRFLYHILCGDENVHELRQRLHAPSLLSELANERVGVGDSDTVVDLVRLGVLARASDGSAPLIPARYHTFARALEGAFLCLNGDHPAHSEQGKPTLFLSRHERCPHCQAIVVELASCPRCGTTYIVGLEQDGHGAGAVLKHPSLLAEDLDARVRFYVRDGSVHLPDEDEAAVDGSERLFQGEALLRKVSLCLACGSIADGELGPMCGCQSRFAVLSRVDIGDGTLSRCVLCGSSRGGSPVYRFMTGRDAPVAVLATSLYQLLPPSRDERAAELPGAGRKLLSFADSRQDAAFFAHYLESTYEQILHRALLYATLRADSAARAGRLRLQDLIGRVVEQAEQEGFFSARQSYDERTRIASTWLMRELVSLDTRMSLEGLGLLRFQVVRPQRWNPPPALQDYPWSLTSDEAWELIVTLLDSLRQQGVMDFPANVDPRSAAFEPRNVELFVRDVSEPKSHVLGWNARARSRSNRREDYLSRVLQRRLGCDQATAKPIAQDTLKGLWRWLTDRSSFWRDYIVPASVRNLGTAYRLDHRMWEWVPVEHAACPIYRCSRCAYVAYTSLSGVCPMYGCDGTLVRIDGSDDAWGQNHYRHLYQSLELIPLRAQEHTAQWRPDEAAKIQSAFIRGEVNALSCSTTFELGVDLGDLNAVLMRNVPPSIANYVQRAGRAGRRTDAVPFVLTFAQRRSHDLSHYRDPARLVNGRVQPPRLEIGNEIIVRRHMHAILLADFFRWAYRREGEWRRSVGAFFVPGEGKETGPCLLRRYLAERPDSVSAALVRVVPRGLQQALGVDDWSWLPKLIVEDQSGILDRAEPEHQAGLLDKVESEASSDLALYHELEDRARCERNYSLAESYKRVGITVRSRDLLGFLASRNVLPKYGFPTDVVELRTQHLPEPEAQQVELERDLRIAISEYAPGSELVAAKRLWHGGGIYCLPGRKWQTLHYAVCGNCGRFHRTIGALERTCSVCGERLRQRGSRYGEYLYPEFGFIASRQVGIPGQAKPERTYASRVYFSEYTSQEAESRLLIDRAKGPLEASIRYSRYGRLAVVNSGYRNSGFRVCEVCGWAEPAPLTRRDGAQKRHENPRTGRPCAGPISTYHLGHEFITDVLEIRFAGRMPMDNDQDLWLSVLYALIEGAAQCTGIPRDDLDGTLYPYQRGCAPALVLYDNVPGGAGHVRRIGEDLRTVAEAAHARVRDCECGPETSCYECLRSYHNQYYHDQLRRGKAEEFLQVVIAGLR